MSERPIGRPEDNIYTVLIAIAALVVVAGTVYLTMRGQHMFGSWNPFSGA